MTSDDRQLAELRRLATSICYRMLGSRTDAEDLAQDALLRAAPAVLAGEVRNPEAFITTIATRACLDHLRSARVRRESYVGPWLPEPVETDVDVDPGDAAELADEVEYAVLVALQTLSPVERAALLLHDVLGHPYDDVAGVLDRSADACRQAVSRARRRLKEPRAERPVDPASLRDLVDAFVSAAGAGDERRLVSLLAEDATLVSDGGPSVRAARRPVVGRARVVRFLCGVGPRLFGSSGVRIAHINGEPGFVVELADRVHLAGTLDARDGRIRAVRWVVNPDKLRWIGAGVEPSAGGLC